VTGRRGILVLAVSVAILGAAAPDALVSLIHSMWSLEPSDRPALAAIVEQLNNISQ
jgi:hypothetical protein